MPQTEPGTTLTWRQLDQLRRMAAEVKPQSALNYDLRSLKPLVKDGYVEIRGKDGQPRAFSTATIWGARAVITDKGRMALINARKAELARPWSGGAA